ncbi:MAG TPA: laccase domain-containing protein [Candidatus Saccharimonadales bacterium]|nr:laccase domain-containing protein [Candidatus Saccharimonadales bacterium]
MKVLVAVSKVSDGNMHIRTDKANRDVINNRSKFLEKHGVDIRQTTRVSTIYEGDDYCRYYEVGANQKGDGMLDGDVITSDALVTKDMNHALFLPIADCIGMVIFDPSKNILMMSHLGRQALERNGGNKSVIYLVENYECNPTNLLVWLSPAPGSDSYPLFSFNNRSLKDVAREQLESAGIRSYHITDNSADTSKDNNYFSHSEFLKGNRTIDGRFAMVAMMENE